MSATIVKSLTFVMFILFEKIATSKFLPHIDFWLAGLMMRCSKAELSDDELLTR